MSLSPWQIQEAKAKFSQLITAALEQDQFVTFRGQLIAVVVSKERYDELTKPCGTLLDFFKKAPDIDIEIERSRELPRDISL